MKRILGTAIAAVLVAGAGLVAPAAASAAVPSNVVTSKEFSKVSYGNSISYVRSTFGNNGKVVERNNPRGTRNDYVRLTFPTYYEGGTVEAEFLRRSSGTWYLVAKYAWWGNTAKRTADKATLSEFNKVKRGNSIAHARKTFGTNGTIVQRYEAPGTKYDLVTLEWPTSSAQGWVQVSFVKRSSGAWKVDLRAAYWDATAKRTANKATRSEFDKVKIGNSIDHARSTFDTGGTINYYVDAPGVKDDEVWLLWPTESRDGFVEVDFDKRRSGAWKAIGRWASWADGAAPTDDVATEQELTSLRDRLEGGQAVTLAKARKVLGSAGTIMFRGDQSGTEYDRLVVHWYTGTAGTDVAMNFVVSGGTWTALTVDDVAGPWSGAMALRSAEPTESAEPSGTAGSPIDRPVPARPTWERPDLG